MKSNYKINNMKLNVFIKEDFLGRRTIWLSSQKFINNFLKPLLDTIDNLIQWESDWKSSAKIEAQIGAYKWSGTKSKTSSHLLF